jgi:NADPH:quinone reductase-like Zn-dependent oxidoreductase
MKAKAIVVNEIGGPGVLQFAEVEVPAPGPGEVLLRHRAIGLNFVEIYFRSGVYPAPSMPFTPGSEAAGVVEAIGPGVTELKPGDRVAYAGGPMGAYSEARVIPARFLVKLPATIDESTAAAAMLKGMTAHALIFSVYAIKPGDTILVQAAAGGVGLILCQWAKHLGATVIGAVGSDEKARLAAAHGCDHTIVYTREDIVARVKEITGDAPSGLRFGRPGNVHEVDRLPAPARPDGRIRTGVRHRAAVQREYPECQGLALSDPAHAANVHREARGIGRTRGGTFRRNRKWYRQVRGAAALSATRCRRGSSRPGRAQHHGIKRADALIVASGSDASELRCE